MTIPVGLFRITSLLFVSFVLSGCLPSAPKDEEKEPYYLAGKSRINTMDFKGAIESFEKAVEVNPKSAPAHFELGWLYDEKESDPAAAIYHYERFLELAPNSGKEDLVKTRILACKQQLAQTVTLGPVSEKQRREYEQVVEQNKRLQDEVQRWHAYAEWLQGLTNRTVAGAPAARPAQAPDRAATGGISPSNAPSPGRTAATPASSARTHLVKAGENPILIARKYGVSVEALMAANPKINPRRLQVGQALIIPAP
jgi:tetratricopeptide (TPR) repeat protein